MGVLMALSGPCVQVYSNFRGGGGGARLKQEVAQEAVRHGMSRNAKNARNAGAADV